MENNLPDTQKKPKRKLDLYIGIVILILGFYRFYEHYFNGVEFSTFKIVLTYVMVGIGFYNLYKYFVLSQKN
ncbi:hypothetical protein [Aurantibacter sp.]|uniref:hypothetical protein n=1 Tax=Aurantibacter sp. TaxID=2807103 RepID=UPI0035C82172